MLPVLGLTAATLGLLGILGLVYREVRHEAGPAEKRALGAVAVAIAAVWLFYVLTRVPAGH